MINFTEIENKGLNLRKNKEYRKREIKRIINSAVRYTILSIGAFIMLYPILWLIGASFKTNAEIFTSISFIPPRIDFTPYIKGWITGTQYTFATYFANTFKYVIPRVVFTVISSTITAYGFARFNFPFKKLLFGILIATLFLPEVVTRIPLYLLWRQLHLLDTFVPLYAPMIFANQAFFVFMLVQFFRTIPRELDEAAIIDGCNSFQVLTKILVPTIKPAVITVALFQFMWSMNDFIGPLIYISSVEKYPVSIALKMAIDTTEGYFEWNQIIAMSLIALLPSIIVFFAAQKYFVEGIATTGLKG
ncbi:MULTISPECIES: carbohydrate ABC transporter permease [Thermoanaerobacter]|uniref:Binding-protein-dependent transport systems inner membrane component n=1 Tax=Thermoanaerobacter italicus (strain DSM 9252 / Ab9) TaxID=580331 RepID=D3T429_THEIA|nr:carbohydrate ABC transporter permease [Thermoanaerobacter italicus]ADD02981.1 binding-protein-dependent transport systems inner membrane component [Thermoanaerobacter italicus Ab9]